MRIFQSVHYLLLLYACIAFSNSSVEYTKALAGLEKKGEVYFRFTMNTSVPLKEITTIISIDNVSAPLVYAYANREEFERFLTYGIIYEVLTHPGDRYENPSIAGSSNCAEKEWDTYPTYQEYLDMMNKYQHDYPDRCTIVEIGKSVQGRKLLFAKISDNVNQAEPEPRFMYTSSMHGDETTGYVLMLRLIDYLLSNYSSDTQVKRLVDSMEIWIMPLENPDGTYFQSNNSVSGSRRNNANNYDLNRNYPNPNHTTSLQPEVKAMMNFVDTLDFVMAGNFHGGTELLNFPWDSWKSSAKKHADHEWWKKICREYVDEVHSVSSSLMTAQNNGVTHGGDWYVVYGSRQDYMNYYHHIKEVTIEISETKTLPGNQLPKYWNAHYKSFLGYMKNCLYGIRGIVKDSVTQKPLRARISVKNHDKDSSHVYSKLPFGDFYRPLLEGTYTIEISCDDYYPKTVSNIRVTDKQATVIDDVLLKSKITEKLSSLNGTNLNHHIVLTKSGFTVTLGKNHPFNKALLYQPDGKCVWSSNVAGEKILVWNRNATAVRTYSAGCYILKLCGPQESGIGKIIVSN